MCADNSASDRLDGVSYFEPGKPQRRLNVLLIGEANARDIEPGSTDFLVYQIRPSEKFALQWQICFSDRREGHDEMRTAEAAKNWLKWRHLPTVKEPILLIVHDEAGTMIEAWSIRSEQWRQLPMKVPKPILPDIIAHGSA